MHRRPTAIRLPPLVHLGTLPPTDHPDWALSREHQDRPITLPRRAPISSLRLSRRLPRQEAAPRITTVARTNTSSYRSGAIMGGGRKANIVGFPLGWHAGDIGVNQPPIIT